MISGVAASIGCPERGASHVDVWPRLNSFTQLYTVANTGADVLWTLSNSVLISFGVKPFICTCLITTRNSWLFSFCKNAKIVRFNRLQKWNHAMNFAQNLTLISWRCYLLKSNVTWQCPAWLRVPSDRFSKNLLTCPRTKTLSVQYPHICLSTMALSWRCLG